MTLVLEHWYSALRSQSGVCLTTNDPIKLKAALYKARKESLDPNLMTLSIVQSPTADHEVWIVHSSAPITSEADAET